MDALHEHIHEQLGESYEIGDAGIVLNEMIAEGLLEVDESLIENQNILVKNK